MLAKKEYGPAVDVYAIGVILYILLCGFPPFYDDNEAINMRNIAAGNFEFPEPWWDDVSEEAVALVKRLMVSSSSIPSG